MTHPRTEAGSGGGLGAGGPGGAPGAAAVRDRRLPRYATYPTASRFGPGIGAAELDAWTAALPPAPALALALHVPFCARLCAFCCCRTQRARSAAEVERYAAALGAEIARAGRLLPAGAAAVAMAWRGGTPTILAAPQIRALGARLRAAAPLATGAEFVVEVEPQGLPGDRLEALLAAGMTTAEIGLQDFAPGVQEALGIREEGAPGRARGPEQVAAAAAALRAAGVARLTLELLYGLPRQGVESFAATCAVALALAPDRLLLAGYAHVPWMARRQRLVPPETLPGPQARREQAAAGRAAFLAAGFVEAAVGLYVRPDDPLAGGSRRVLGMHLGRAPDAALGFGAGSISALPQGYVQNVAETGAYVARAAAGAAARGLALGLEDRVRGRAIEMLLCERRVDLGRLAAEFGDFAALAAPACAEAARRYPGLAAASPAGLALAPATPGQARAVARLFDAYAEA